MKTEEQRVGRVDIEDIRSKISSLFAQCLGDIEDTVSGAGLTMKDVGIDVGTYVLCGDTCIVELKMQLSHHATTISRKRVDKPLRKSSVPVGHTVPYVQIVDRS
ncbi:MAG TPA: hypothetical protein PLA18_02595 [Deltaproteobacteria bacterium]|nr:hypothetical protein [Deltaproteobacteria bacterium]